MRYEHPELVDCLLLVHLEAARCFDWSVLQPVSLILSADNTGLTCPSVHRCISGMIQL